MNDTIAETAGGHATLHEGLTRLEQSLSDDLKYPSWIEQAQGALYRAALTLLLESGCMSTEVADAVCHFLASVDRALAHRRLTETWQHNQYWFAGSSSGVGVATGPCDSEEEALEKLYVLYPELR